MKGLEELTANLQKLATLADNTLLLNGAEVLLGHIKDNAPVSTGVLRDGYEIVDGAITTNVPYAADVEYGTQRSPAQPHVRPAVDEHKDDVAKAIAESFSERIAKVL